MDAHSYWWPLVVGNISANHANPPLIMCMCPFTIAPFLFCDGSLRESLINGMEYGLEEWNGIMEWNRLSVLNHK